MTARQSSRCLAALLLVGALGCGEDAVSIAGSDCPELEIYAVAERNDAGELVNKPAYRFNPSGPKDEWCVTPVGTASTTAPPKPKGSGGASADGGRSRDAATD